MSNTSLPYHLQKLCKINNRLFVPFQSSKRATQKEETEYYVSNIIKEVAFLTSANMITKTNCNLEDKIKDLNIKLKTANEEKEQLENIIPLLRSVNDETQKKLDEANFQLKLKDEKIQKLQDDKKQLEENINGVKTKCATDVKNLEDKIKMMEKSLNNSTGHTKTLENRCEEYTSLIKELEAKVEKSNSLLEDLQRYKHKCISLESKIKESEHKLKDCEHKLKSYDEKVRKLENNNNDTKRSASSYDLEAKLKSKLSKTQEDLTKAQKEIELKALQATQIKTKLSHLESVNKSLQKELEEKNYKIENLESSNNSIRRTISLDTANTNPEIDSLKSQNSVLSEKLRFAEYQYDFLKIAFTNFQTNIINIANTVNIPDVPKPNVPSDANSNGCRSIVTTGATSTPSSIPNFTTPITPTIPLVQANGTPTSIPLKKRLVEPTIVSNGEDDIVIKKSRRSTRVID